MEKVSRLGGEKQKVYSIAARAHKILFSMSHDNLHTKGEGSGKIQGVFGHSLQFLELEIMALETFNKLEGTKNDHVWPKQSFSRRSRE